MKRKFCGVGRDIRTNKYLLPIAILLCLVCGTTLAGGNATPEEIKKTQDAVQELMNKGIYADDPRFIPAMEKATGTKTTYAPGYDWYGKIAPGVAPRYGPTVKGDVPTGFVQAQHEDNLVAMKEDLATMAHDREIISAAVAQGKNPNDPAFREAFENAEQAANGAVQQPIKNTFVKIVPREKPLATKVQESTAHKSLVSLEKKDAK